MRGYPIRTRCSPGPSRNLYPDRAVKGVIPNAVTSPGWGGGPEPRRLGGLSRGHEKVGSQNPALHLRQIEMRKHAHRNSCEPIPRETRCPRGFAALSKCRHRAISRSPVWGTSISHMGASALRVCPDAPAAIGTFFQKGSAVEAHVFLPAQINEFLSSLILRVAIQMSTLRFKMGPRGRARPFPHAGNPLPCAYGVSRRHTPSRNSRCKKAVSGCSRLRVGWVS